MSTGKVVQVIGPVVDVEFSLNDKLPDINNALIIQKDNDDTLTVEVSLDLDDGEVRTVAMDGKDGMRRGLTLEDTGSYTPVPGGKEP